MEEQSRQELGLMTSCKIGYEYAEHQFLGNHISLKYRNPKSVTDPTPDRIEVAKKAANIVPIKLGEGGDALSLGRGEISALTGDFYGTEDPVSDGKLDAERKQRLP
ncbi:eukaryotic translation initiation factor 2C 3 [Metarhizium robertsii ARSEF 23]|uniref:Eukaryotic translation initiation factor 2C 3 n=1 Tax=Metarhizium robertsii (strain ARSEF 23 / ATCC MYA-3075) TaxID=655844 RepID=A0A0B2X8N5_METRA|nr:eukaryotic translation initiation factor 2C 3 [Metarhizium robertsii ARSEF 23]KHO11238.1 eukaryotic translation initiation factor 2C 3 [Metarhizium robertsii ARSEF 23]